jgi:hypothetical protein
MEIGVCKSSKMGIRTMWYVHEHLINKSHAQAKLCKWLMKMEPILGDKFALDSLHSSGLDLGGGHHLPPYILNLIVRVFKFPSCEFHNFVSFLLPISFNAHLQMETLSSFSISKLWKLSNSGRTLDLDKIYPIILSKNSRHFGIL